MIGQKHQRLGGFGIGIYHGYLCTQLMAEPRNRRAYALASAGDDHGAAGQIHDRVHR